MNNETHEPTNAEIFASLLRGNASMQSIGATVQRSHRFPLHYFVQIESMAKAAKIPVSVVINQLIACGLEAVTKELPEDVVTQLTSCTMEQLNRPTKTVKVTVKERDLVFKSKSNSEK